MKGGAESVIEEVYIGSEEVSFIGVSGSVELFSRESCWIDPHPESALKRAKSRAVRLLGSEEDDDDTATMILFDCVPALDITGGLTSERDPPTVLAAPLLKVPAAFGGKIGIRSGGRSALICSDCERDGGEVVRVWYRLKGCGNYVDQEGMRFPFPGLPLREVSVFGEVIGKELRGCSFPFSSLRELYMTDLLQEVCMEHTFATQHGLLEPLRIGNRPIGMWSYHMSDKDLPKGLPSALDELVDTPTSCTLFETVGEKRLEAHLIKGLCNLIEMGLLACADPSLTLSILQSRKRKSGSGLEIPTPIETWAACCSGEDPCEPVDFSSAATVAEGALLHVDDKRLCSGGDSSAAVPPRMQELWMKSWRVVATYSENCRENGVSLVGQLAWRLGWECGDFARLLQGNDVIWGYFFDHNPFEPHCNSHSNNFIVVPPFSDHEDGSLTRFLSPCDFDMAYVKDHFISPYSRGPDHDLFESWKKTESMELARSLGGESANSGVADSPEHQSCSSSDALGQAPVFALRDTLLHGYYEVFDFYRPVWTWWAPACLGSIEHRNASAHHCQFDFNISTPILIDRID